MPASLNENTFEIILLTLKMSFLSTLISSFLGISLGLALEAHNFPLKKIIVRLNRTLMGVPPVVVGLFVYLLVMRNGPLGFLNILFTLPGMVLAQTLIITPIICGMVHTAAERNAAKIRAFAVTMGASRTQTQLLLLCEMSQEIYFAVITGFGRSISEVGAVMIVGGNILHKTRVMTTAITMLRSKGSYDDAIFLGIVLMLIAFFIQTIADFLRRGERNDESY